jgi:hypothetical protein
MRANEPDFFVVNTLAGDASSGETLSSPNVLPDELVGDELPESFLAALPRISSAISAADFFLVFSSSDERLEDMMVSRVPMARLLLLVLLLLFLCRLMLRSSSEVTACSVGPCSWLCVGLGKKVEPDP